MKIAIVCFNLSWQAGGVRLIFSEAHTLKRLGHSVIIYTPDFDPTVYPDLQSGLNIRVVSLSDKLRWQYRSESLSRRILEKFAHLRALRKTARGIADAMDSDLEIVNLHDFAYQAAPFYRNKNPRAKIIWTMNDPPYQYLPKASFIYDVLSRIFNFWRDISERHYFKFIDKVAVLVSKNKIWAEERRMEAVIIWSGLEFKKFYASPKSISDKGKKDVVLLSIGTLNRYRRFEDTIGAIKFLRDWGYDARAKIICKDIWNEKEYRRELHGFVRRTSVADRVELLFDGVSENELAQVYATSDFFILPIHLPPPRSGFGWQLVIFEAMAAGLPSIVCRTNDVTEALKDGETALFVEPMSPQQIAEIVRRLIDRPEEYLRIAKSGQEFVRQNMSWEKYAERFLRLVEAE